MSFWNVFSILKRFSFLFTSFKTNGISVWGTEWWRICRSKFVHVLSMTLDSILGFISSSVPILKFHTLKKINQSHCEPVSTNSINTNLHKESVTHQRCNQLYIQLQNEIKHISTIIYQLKVKDKLMWSLYPVMCGL